MHIPNSKFATLVAKWKAKRSPEHEEAYSKARNPRAIEFADLAEVFRKATSEHFFVDPKVLTDVITAVARLGYKPDAARMAEELRQYLSAKSAETLAKPALVELQRSFIWTHAEARGFAPSVEIAAMYGKDGVDAPQVVKDILAAAVARYGSMPYRPPQIVRDATARRENAEQCVSEKATGADRARRESLRNARRAARIAKQPPKGAGGGPTQGHGHGNGNGKKAGGKK